MRPSPVVDVADFDAQGFLGPFDCEFPDDRVSALGERCTELVRERRRHPVYGRYALRDWHLVDDELLQLLTAPAIVERVARILGPDLLLWRSKVFYKPPGGDPVGWHQEWGAFDGEEIGNHVPSLAPADPGAGIWDLTVWIALRDVGPDDGPLQFARGTNHSRVPWRTVPMDQSAFFEDPFAALDATEIERRTRSNELILDIETADWLDDLDRRPAGREELVRHLGEKVRRLPAKFTDFDPDPASVVTMTVPAGHCVIFSERTMHGSPANTSARDRIAVNARIAKSDTLVYPGRLSGRYLDGSNLDIRNHACVLVGGEPLEQRNVWR